MNTWPNHFKTALSVFLALTLVTGIIYPAIIWSIAQWLFPNQANGSLIYQNNQLVGSALIGQYFDRPEYFWGRPSATQPIPYRGDASKGSNLGPSNPELLTQVNTRLAQLGISDLNLQQPIPAELVTASGSGLDPEISPETAFYQVYRVAKSRKIPQSILLPLIKGEVRVNVLKLNLALDQLSETHGKHTP